MVVLASRVWLVLVACIIAYKANTIKVYNRPFPVSRIDVYRPSYNNYMSLLFDLTKKTFFSDNAQKNNCVHRAVKISNPDVYKFTC